MSIFSIFGCSHNNLSRVWTLPIRTAKGWTKAATHTYKVCLDCGKEFEYDLENMCIGSGHRKIKTREQEA